MIHEIVLGMQTIDVPGASAIGECPTSGEAGGAMEIYTGRAGRAQGAGPWAARQRANTTMTLLRAGACFGRLARILSRAM